jgi:integrase
MSKATTPKRRRRTRGEGSIYKTAGGRWRGAFVVPDPRTGLGRRRVVSGRSAAEVRERLATIRREIEALGPDAATPSLTVAEWLGRWLPGIRGRMRPATWRSHEQYVRGHIVPALGRISLASLRPSDVEAMTAAMIDRGLSPTTARSARTTLRIALADAMRDGLIVRNAAALARPPRMIQRPIEYLDPAEIRRLLDATADEDVGPLYAVAASTGLRQGELLGMSWDDIDLDDASLTVRRSLARDWFGGYTLAEPKSARSRRTIALPTVAMMALRRRRARQAADRLAAGTGWQDRHELVFTDEYGRPLVPSAVTKAFSRALADAGVRHVPFHALRHSYATAALAGGVPLSSISDQLGHSTVAITATYYAAIVPSLKREAAAAIDRALGVGT